jgi:hypothetical protein
MMMADEYTTDKLLDICGVDNGWAADELRERFEALRATLMRCSTLCNHLAVERPAGWRRWVFGRWMIAHEPLRGDARRLLEDIGNRLRP